MEKFSVPLNHLILKTIDSLAHKELCHKKYIIPHDDNFYEHRMLLTENKLHEYI